MTGPSPQSYSRPLFRSHRQHPATTCNSSMVGPHRGIRVRGCPWSSVAVEQVAQMAGEARDRSGPCLVRSSSRWSWAPCCIWGWRSPSPAPSTQAISCTAGPTQWPRAHDIGRPHVATDDGSRCGGCAGPARAERKRGVNVGSILNGACRKFLTCGVAPPAGLEPAA